MGEGTWELFVLPSQFLFCDFKTIQKCYKKNKIPISIKCCQVVLLIDIKMLDHSQRPAGPWGSLSNDKIYAPYDNTPVLISHWPTLTLSNISADFEDENMVISLLNLHFFHSIALKLYIPVLKNYLYTFFFGLLVHVLYFSFELLVIFVWKAFYL